MMEAEIMVHKLYKSENDKILAGVCGGLAEYLDIDSTIIRLIWAVLSLSGGAGIWLYLMAALIIPKDHSIIEGKYYEET